VDLIGYVEEAEAEANHYRQFTGRAMAAWTHQLSSRDAAAVQTLIAGLNS